MLTKMMNNKSRWQVRLGGLGLVILLLGACNGTSSTSLSTDTKSSELATEGEQIEFLGRYVTLKSAVSETEFHIVYHDNSGGGLAGPSDWDIRVVMRVDDVGAWIDGKTEVDAADFSWAEGLLVEGLRPTSEPVYYGSGTTMIAVFEGEQIIFFRSTTVP